MNQFMYGIMSLNITNINSDILKSVQQMSDKILRRVMMMNKAKIRELIGILMESTFYFEMPLKERLTLIKYMLDGELIGY